MTKEFHGSVCGKKDSEFWHLIRLRGGAINYKISFIHPLSALDILRIREKTALLWSGPCFNGGGV